MKDHGCSIKRPLLTMPPFIRGHGGLISISFLMALFSGFGQSVFFGAYIPQIQESLGLTKTTIGSLYTMATLVSAVIIIYTGKMLDHLPLQRFVTFVLCGLAMGCFVLSNAQNTAMIFLAFLLLRQCGQGLMGLTATTTINRYMTTGRGKAMALIQLGHPANMIAFPFLAFFIARYMEWHSAWFIYGLFVLFVLLPGFWFYLRTHQETRHAKWEAQEKANNENPATALGKIWTRTHVLQDWRFYSLMALTVIPPFTGTAIFFYQGELATSLALTPLMFASSFPFFTITSAICSFLTGAVIDKHGEKSSLIVYPLCTVIGLLFLTNGHNIALVYAGMTFLGASFGIIATISAPLLARIYGTKHLGAIKSLFFSSSIVSSAIPPVLFGFLMDYGYDIKLLLSWVVYYTAATWFLTFRICDKKYE